MYTPLRNLQPTRGSEICILLYLFTCLSLSLSVTRGLILQDLTFVHLGNPDTLMTSQGLKVNFSKRWQQFNILDTLRSYQQASVVTVVLGSITCVFKVWSKTSFCFPLQPVLCAA